ncbi:hypothetical protein [Pseudonocardia sp.]|uniref:hypothetical protein n=1 Tax=Pseudonocardia sp. TaxID=60912 RepID=UPI00261A3344|nr:hypothetical protein [Pseudonocardia sp.]
MYSSAARLKEHLATLAEQALDDLAEDRLTTEEALRLLAVVAWEAVYPPHLDELFTAPGPPLPRPATHVGVGVA